MKRFRLLKSVLGLAVAVSLILTPIEMALASQLDQSNESSSISNINIVSYDEVAQTFIPTMAQLDRIDVYAGNGGGSWLSGKLIRVSTGETVATGGTRVGDWDWEPVINTGTLVPGETYKIVVETEYAHQWKLGTNGYANGVAYLGAGAPQADRDFWFRTYGTPASSPTPTPSASPTTTASPSPGSGIAGSAPSKNIDTSIKSPVNLKAEDVSDRDKNEPKVKLTWEASETKDIEGYRVYSKKEADADFVLVAEINKDTKEYTDAKIEFDKKYTYMVRAYKSDKESESSNEVTITPKKEPRILKNFGYLSFAGPIWKQWYFWTLVALSLALIGFVVWYIIGRIRTKKTQRITAESIKS
ncbi:fibronectin type III domain-containing protein [Patescibacteria group bacterium]|nr:fibronectin type III domain-containing protein [Patescibacteria group bacterium]